ncbi:hypothetical protein GCM10023093_01320 [Nemorincola caseinilytica]|uniref:Uncharacterized protein n=1 Tax=Nemorincola caseinilytica TaxID=2054315 RepID=A0ABP8N551_9BACT
MFFTRTYEFDLGGSRDEFMKKLIGKHVTIHNLDFEIYEQEERLCIAPHAEQVTSIKTLPITWVDLKSNNGRQRISMRSSIRQLDAGGPQLIIIFCIFLLVAAIVLLFTSGGDKKIMFTFLGLDAIIYGLFWLRMKRGYLDYVHKIRDYVKDRAKG